MKSKTNWFKVALEVIRIIIAAIAGGAGAQVM